MRLRKIWQFCRILFHFLFGLIELWWAGGHRQPFHADVRELIRRWYARLLQLLNVEVEVIGSIPHERDGAVIIIANHISWVDIPLIGGLTPVNFLSKAEVADWPLVGAIAKKTGTLFISRGSGDTGQVMQAMKAQLEKHHAVLIFPEGTTTDGSKIRRFHKKLFKVCEQTQVVLHPMLIRYHAATEHNPVPYVGEIGFGSHFWQLLGGDKIQATVESLPAVRLDPHIVGQQLREIELAMRERLGLNNLST
jgi:1-acyl-sn-glycerol-3-phosphate acyltransferase